METVTRTIYGSALQTAQMLGIPHVIKPNTTVNERLTVLKTAVVPEGVYPRVQYFCIGNGGHQLVSGADGIPLTKAVQHRATDASLYKPLPFVLRATNDDLSPLERANYAMRRVETYGGVSYYAYHLRRIPMDTVSVATELRNITDGVTTSVNFIATSANLAPSPPTINNAGANVLTSDYVTCSARLSISLTEGECTELLNAAKIIFGDDNYAIISEIGLCAGADKVILLPDNTNFKEAIGVQIISHVAAFHAVKFSSSGINGLFDLGTNEPQNGFA